MTSALLQRAQQLALGAGLGAMAITPLSADAALLTSSDLVVQGSGAYFYNASGYFATWGSSPDGGTVQELNADGSAKFYGSASADAADFQAHNCVDGSCARVGARGVALVWWGTLKNEARAGDQLKVHYDMLVDTGLFGGNWSVNASLLSWEPSNSVGGGQSGYANGYLEAGSEPLSVMGDFYSRALEEWDLGGNTVYWQIVATATGNLGQWLGDTYAYGDVSLVVPGNSIDVSVYNALAEPGGPGNAVPLPGSLALALLGLGLLPRRRKA